MTTVIEDHKTNAVNGGLAVAAMNEPGPGGACTHYRISGYDPLKHPSAKVSYAVHPHDILFQDGIENLCGVTNESVLAILTHRMRGFQSGKFACQENADALHHMELALHALKLRSTKRVERGVDNSHTP